MSEIRIGIFDEHKLVQEGLRMLLADVSDMEVVMTATTRPQLNEKLSSADLHVLIINLHSINTPKLNHLLEINIISPEAKILIISAHNEEDLILKTIKSGAKGFLDRDTGKKELVEAIYALRSGHDYYSNSITHLLLNKYISKLQSHKKDNNSSNLSAREIEIVKLWGDSHTNKEIADILFISVRTVESHKNHIMQKLNLRTSVDLIKFAIKNNIIEI
jgi:two-component system response regulator NreC